MHPFTILSILLSFGAFAASMTTDLPEVVSNTTTGDWKGIDSEYDDRMQIFRKYYVRTDGMEVEPRDLICAIYSRLVSVDDSFRSNPPCLYALFFGEVTSRSFERKMGDLQAKCEPSYEREECLSYVETLVFMQSAVVSDETIAFYRQHLGLVKDAAGDVLTKPEMCGEGWKHGQKYIEGRQSVRDEAKSSPV